MELALQKTENWMNSWQRKLSMVLAMKSRLSQRQLCFRIPAAMDCRRRACSYAQVLLASFPWAFDWGHCENIGLVQQAVLPSFNLSLQDLTTRPFTFSGYIPTNWWTRSSVPGYVVAAKWCTLSICTCNYRWRPTPPCAHNDSIWDCKIHTPRECGCLDKLDWSCSRCGFVYHRSNHFPPLKVWLGVWTWQPCLYHFKTEGWA